MSTRIPIWLVTVLLPLAFGTVGRGESFRPKAFKIPGTPNETSNYMKMLPGKAGWTIEMPGGFLQQAGLDWRVVWTPEISDATYAVPYDFGVVTAGIGVATLQKSGAWVITRSDDVFRGGLSVGNSVLLAGEKGACLVGADGRATEVLHYPEPVRIALLHMLKGHPVLNTIQPTQVYQWQDGKFSAAEPSLAFTHPDLTQYWIGLNGTDAGYYFDGVDCTPADIIVPSQVLALRDIWREVAPKHIISRLLQYHDTLCVPTEQGLLGYSLQSGKQLWSIGNEDLEGNARYVTGGRDGLLVSGLNGTMSATLPIRGGLSWA